MFICLVIIYLFIYLFFLFFLSFFLGENFDSDLNPLKPCGACNEWLKKIAEVNPQLRVITFTDAGCRGVHIEQIDD